MNDVVTLLRKHFPSSSEELCFGGLSVNSLASKFGTPFFVYDRSVLDRKLALLREALPPRFAISYSVKANPNGAFLRYFLKRGCGLEIASGGEFLQALKAECPPSRIVFAGPGKSESELDLVLRHRVGEIHAESALELDRISAISRRLGTPANVALRINPTGDAQGGAMRMGGKPAPFGIDEECVTAVLDRVLSDDHLNFQGIHLFTGTQILDAEILLNQYRKGLDLALQIARRVGHPLHTVDFGGGLGIPYFSNEIELDLDKVREGLSTLHAQIESETFFSGTQFMVEPGRFLVGEAGVYVTRVTDVKDSRGKKFVIVDGGMNHHLAASGNLGQTIKRNYPLAVLNRLKEAANEVVDVVGPLCTPLDVLGRSVQFPSVAVGDLIGVFQSGAYARTASPLGFLSHPAPPEVWVEAGKDFLIRRRGECNAYVADQCWEDAAVMAS
jgi:diaminopimelate decarboxylase